MRPSLSHRKAKGNRQRKLPEELVSLMEEFIEKQYETLKQKSIWSVYCSLKEACEQKGIITPSYKTFSKEIKKCSGYKQTLKRQGRRAAYAQSEFYWELTRTTPIHGDRPFEIGHIDHTQFRYDPFNIGIAYAFVQGQWVECISQYYSEFQGHSERELKLATSELRKRQAKNTKQSKVSAKKLAEFISSIEAEEILLEQRLHDAEVEDVFQVINGGKDKPHASKVINITKHQDISLIAEVSQESSDNMPSESLVVYEEF